MSNYYKTGRTFPYFAAGISTGTVAGHTASGTGNSDGFQGEARLPGCSFSWDSGVGNVGGVNTWVTHGQIWVNQGFGANPGFGFGLGFPPQGSYSVGTDSQTVADPANFTATISWDVTGTVEETIGFPDTATGGSPDTNLAIYHQFAVGSVLTCRLTIAGTILILTGAVTQAIPFAVLASSNGDATGETYNPFAAELHLQLSCSDGSLPRGTADTAAGTNYITSFPYLMKVQAANGSALTDYSVPSDPNYIVGAHGYNVRTYKLGNQYRTEADISITSSGVAGDGRYPKNYAVGTVPTFGTLRSYTVNSWLERDDKQYDNPVPMYVSATDPNVSTSVKQAVYVAIKGFGSADYTQYGYTSCGLPKSFNPPQDFSSILAPIVVATDTGSGGVWGDFNNKPTVQKLCGWKWNAINLTQAASADVDTAPSTTNWSVVPEAVGSVTLSNSGGLRIVTGAAIVNIVNNTIPPAIYSPLTQASLSVYNASQPNYFSFAGYRWLRIYVSTPAASAKMSVFLQITPHNNLYIDYDSGVYMRWDTIVTSGYIDIDLMCPTNALNVWEEGHGGVIGQTFQGFPDSSYPQLQGVDRVYSASLQTDNRQYGFQLRFDPNTTYTLSSLQLITQDHRIVDFNPDKVDPQTDTDGKGMQLSASNNGTNTTSIVDFCTATNGIFQVASPGGYTSTTYTAPTNGLTAIPLNVIGDSAHVFNGLINATLPAAWIWGAGYIPTLNQWGFGASLDSTQGNSGIQPAQFMFTKLATFPPNCGDIFGMDQNGTIPISLPPLQLRTASVMRVQYKGVVHTPLSLPSVGTTVTVTRLSDSTIMGSGVTDKWGYYTADTSGFDLLLSATLSDHLVVVSAGSVSTPHGNTAIRGDKGIRRQWVHFKGVNSGSGPPGGGTPPGGGIPPGGGVPGNSNFGTNPFCFQDQWGRLHQTLLVKGAPTFYRSDFATPGKNLTWAVTGVTISPAAAAVAPNKGDQFPRSIMDYRGVTTCVWQRNGDTMSSRSHDDGSTWEGAVMAIPGGTYPTIAVGIDGTVIQAALVANADQVGSPGGVIKMRCQSPGAVAYGALYTAQYYSSGLLPIPVAVDSFHLQQGYESASRWVLHCRVQGETGTADYFSSDLDASSWSRLT